MVTIKTIKLPRGVSIDRHTLRDRVCNVGIPNEERLRPRPRCMIQMADGKFWCPTHATHDLEEGVVVEGYEDMSTDELNKYLTYLRENTDRPVRLLTCTDQVRL